MPYSKLIANIADASRDQLIANINQVQTDMPFLVLLTSAEKKKHLQLGKKAEPFFDKTVILAMGNPSILTDIFSVVDMQTRTNDLKAMRAIQTQVNKLNDAVNCTVIALEKENMRDGLYFYKLAQGAATQNVPGADAIVKALESMLPRTCKKRIKKEKK